MWGHPCGTAMWGRPPSAVHFEQSSNGLMPQPFLILFFRRTFAHRFSDHFLRHALLRRLRSLPLLIPTIMERLVTRLFFHNFQLTPTILMWGQPPSLP